MESCQEEPLQSAVEEWTAVFVRLWMHDINRFTRTTGLSFGQMNLLLHIHYRGACDVTSVSELLQMTPPGASQMVERMVQQGLVTRAEVAGDRRIRLVQLTDEGQSLVDASITAHEKWIHDLADSFTPEEQTRAASVLQILTARAIRLNL